MKFIDLIVDFILDTPKQTKPKQVEKSPVYLPCNEIFGNLSKTEKTDILSYNYVNADFKPENNMVI